MQTRWGWLVSITTITAGAALAAPPAARPPGDGGAVPWSRWVAVGPGGGGHQRWPAISPHDPQLCFVACDMGGFYRSTDQGRTWRMDAVVREVSSPAIFHPTDPKIVYVYMTYGGEFRHGWRLLRSSDRGLTWTTLREKLEGYDINSGLCLALDPARPDWLVAGMGGGLPGKVLLSADGGRTFTPAPGDLPKEAQVMALVLDRASDAQQRTLYAGTTAGVFISNDDAAHWAPLPAQPGDGKLARFVAAQDDEGKTMVFYAIANAASPGEWFPGGGSLYRSADRGKTWQDVGAALVGKSGAKVVYRGLATSDAAPDTVYIGIRADGGGLRPGEYKSTDGGRTWTGVLPGPDYDRINGPARGAGSRFTAGWLTRDPHFSYGWGGEASYIAAGPRHPDVVLRTDDGRTLGTSDGGATWRQLYSDEAPDGRWASRGLEVVTTYEVYFDPREHTRLYAAYTDIGFFRSEDRGRSWCFSLHGARHRNTVYELAIDPANPRVMYAANTDHHDLPQFKMLRQDEKKFRGGLAKTVDGGANWTMIGAAGGLPQGACTSVLIDPASPPERRTLFVCVIGFGVYKSADGGETWRLCDGGMDYLKLNPNAWRLSLGQDGSLYVAITKNIDAPAGKKRTFAGGTIYRSDDRGDTWTRVAPSRPAAASGERNEFAQLMDVCASPLEPGVVYAAAYEDVHCGPHVPGGLWGSRDKGATWTRLFDNEGVARVSLHPTNPKIIYASTGFDGVWRTTDGGATWAQVKGLPFRSVNKVTVDPDDPETIWVATFGGGIWRGPAAGEEPAPRE